MKAEVIGQLEFKTFKVILKEDVLANANMLLDRFVLAIKCVRANKVNSDAPFVIGCHCDKLRKIMVHSSQTIQLSLILLLLTFSPSNSWDIWSSEVRQAYLQSSEQLSRGFFFRDPPPEFDSLELQQCLQILQPLHGLWGHVVQDIGQPSQEWSFSEPNTNLSSLMLLHN